MRIKGKRVRREEKEEGYISKILNLFTHLVEKNQPANAEKGSRSQMHCAISQVSPTTSWARDATCKQDQI